MKRWPHYGLLKNELERAGFDVYYLKQRKNIVDYIKDIDKCNILVSGDTLAMHVGLGLKKQLVTIFMCTSPWEVHDYGRMTKIISPLLRKGFYKKTFKKTLSMRSGWRSLRCRGSAGQTLKEIQVIFCHFSESERFFFESLQR